MDNPSSPQRTPTPSPIGTVHWGFAMSLDGFVAGPGDSTEFSNGATTEEGFFIEQAIASIGAVLTGRDGYDSAIGDSRPLRRRMEGDQSSRSHPPFREIAPPLTTSPFSTAPCSEPPESGLRRPSAKSSASSRRTLADNCCASVSSTKSPFTSSQYCSATESASTTPPGGDLVHLIRRGANPTRAVHLQYVPAGDAG